MGIIEKMRLDGKKALSPEAPEESENAQPPLLLKQELT